MGSKKQSKDELIESCKVFESKLGKIRQENDLSFLEPRINLKVISESCRDLVRGTEKRRVEKRTSEKNA